MHLFYLDYDYDISISAIRYNDNKYDGWVSEFVEKLNQELSATLKDKLSIFFDKNPEDKRGVFHNDDGSCYTKKMKSLIFIPDYLTNILRYQFTGMEE